MLQFRVKLGQTCKRTGLHRLNQYRKVCETRPTFPLTVKSPPIPDLLYAENFLRFKELLLTWR